MRKAAALTPVALGLAALLLTGCGGSDGGDSASAKGAEKASPAQTDPAQTDEPSKESASGTGLDGTWRPINSDSPISTLTISGTKVTTTGKLACPGTISGAGTKKTRISLDCEKPDADREKGDLEMKKDGSAIVIGWDGPDWGGLMDSLRRV